MEALSRRRPGRVFPGIGAAILLAMWVRVPAEAQQTVAEEGSKRTDTAAPDRDGDGTVSKLEKACPPRVDMNHDGTLETAPASDPRDADAGGSSAKDYFLGETKFVKGEEDLIVRVWCIKDGGYYTYELITSHHTSSSEETTIAVAPDNVDPDPNSDGTIDFPSTAIRAGET